MQVKGIVLENIGKILKRGDNLDDLEKTTGKHFVTQIICHINRNAQHAPNVAETLETEAEDFKKNTQKLYDKNCYEYYRVSLLYESLVLSKYESFTACYPFYSVGSFWQS